MTDDDHDSGCPKCKRPWKPVCIWLADMPLYCRQTDDLGCMTAQRDALAVRLAAYEEAVPA